VPFSSPDISTVLLPGQEATVAESTYPIGGSINVKTLIKLKFLYMAYGSLRE
jgi:hypothetical protein